MAPAGQCPGCALDQRHRDWRGDKSVARKIPELGGYRERPEAQDFSLNNGWPL